MRTVYLIRHGQAASREQYARDAERPLTDEGVRKTAACARGFALLGPKGLRLILSSPMVRARQTAELFAQALDPSPKIHSLQELAPADDMSGLMDIVNDQMDGKKLDEIALVGHEPDMSLLVGFLLAGKSGTMNNLRVDFKKAAVCRIDFESKVSPAEGQLVWLIPPAALAAMGR